jgi:CCR4-NOT transcription complex subunit 7/8
MFNLETRNKATQSPIHIQSPDSCPTIKEVWRDNFESEFWKIMELAETYNVVGVDTEFPGMIYDTKTHQYNIHNHFYYSQQQEESSYINIRMNVNELKLIQIGIALSDESGNLPGDTCTWQFNLHFDLKKDQIAEDAYNLLVDSGINFSEHQKRGIDPNVFAEYFIASGLVLTENVKWICFHGGFDFAYLVKLLTGEKLPEDEREFHKLLTMYFPTFYDVKSMVRDVEWLKNKGLSKLGQELKLKRIGVQHQAGSDSLLTLSAYFKLRESTLKEIPERKFINKLHSLQDSIYIFNQIY